MLPESSGASCESPLVRWQSSHQDPGHVEAVLDAFREIAGQGSAVFVASHEPTVVEAATRVIDLTT